MGLRHAGLKHHTLVTEMPCCVLKCRQEFGSESLAPILGPGEHPLQLRCSVIKADEATASRWDPVQVCDKHNTVGWRPVGWVLLGVGSGTVELSEIVRHLLDKCLHHRGVVGFAQDFGGHRYCYATPSRLGQADLPDYLRSDKGCRTTRYPPTNAAAQAVDPPVGSYAVADGGESLKLVVTAEPERKWRLRPAPGASSLLGWAP
jgi:hypothetical protein